MNSSSTLTTTTTTTTILSNGGFGKVIYYQTTPNTIPIILKVINNDIVYQNELFINQYLLSFYKKNIHLHIPNYYPQEPKDIYDNYQLRNTLLFEYIPYKLTDIFLLLSNYSNIYRRMFYYIVAYELLDSIRLIHSFGIIHRDIKPDNILYGQSRGNINSLHLYLIDFGLATFFIQENGKHISNNQLKTIIGTNEYLSLNGHLGNQLARRDDIESYLYTMISIFSDNKQLPWSNETNNSNISESKQYNNIVYLLQFMADDLWFELYIVLLQLKFEETIDYSYWLNNIQQRISAIYQKEFISKTNTILPNILQKIILPYVIAVP